MRAPPGIRTYWKSSTSTRPFNVRGEPIVCSPEDAYRCFRRTHMDVLALGPYLVAKSMFPDAEESIYTAEQIAEAYGLD